MKQTVDQTNLYEKYIKPHEGDLLARIQEYRKLVDKIQEKQMRDDFFENPEREIWEKWSADIQRYPFWHCHTIRNMVLNALEKDMPIYLSDFKNNGWIIQEKWMVYEGKEQWFSNVILIWDGIIDPSFEEFSGTTLNIWLVRASDYSPYKELSMDGIVESAEKYWQEECFDSSHILWPLSFLFSIVSFRKDGGIHFLWSSTRKVIEDSKWVAWEEWRIKNEAWKWSIPEPHYSNLRNMLADIRILSVTNPELLSRIFSIDERKYLSNQSFLEFLFFVEKMLMQKKSTIRLHTSKAYKKFKSHFTKEIWTALQAQYFIYIKRLEDLYNTFIHMKK